MATYIYNPNNITVGVNPIGNGWTMRHNSFSVSSIDAITSPIGSKVWRQHALSGNDLRSVIFDAVSATTDDVEILTLERRNFTDIEIGHLHRCTTTGDINYYFMGSRNNDSEVRTRIITNGSTANQYSAPHNLTYDVAKWYWVRTKIVGTTAMYISMWEYGTTEPATPQLVETGLTLAYSTGVVGLSGFWNIVQAGEYYKDIAWFSVGTAGDPAPDTEAGPRKITVTDLKAPNDANEQVANATGVQVKLWIDKDDVGAPDVLVTDSTITGGTMEVTFDSVAAVGDPALGVAKWEDSNETYFFPIDTTVQEDV